MKRQKNLLICFNFTSIFELEKEMIIGSLTPPWLDRTAIRPRLPIDNMINRVFALHRIA
jgi:hypothetical protein